MQPRRRLNKVFVSSQDYLVTEVRGQSERPEQHFSLIDSLTNQTWTWGELHRCVGEGGGGGGWRICCTVYSKSTSSEHPADASSPDLVSAQDGALAGCWCVCEV